MEITIPFKIEDLLVKPEMSGRLRLSDDIQQTLASLVGFDDIARRLLRCSKGGILYSVNPRIDNILHITTAAVTGLWSGSDVKTTEVMVRGHPDNGGLIWVTPDKVATADNGWPIAANEVVILTIDNLLNLNLLAVTPEEKAIIAYTR